MCGMDTRAQFHQCSTYSFYARGAQKRKKDSQVISLFTPSGPMSVKADRKYVGEIDTRRGEIKVVVLLRGVARMNLLQLVVSQTRTVNCTDVNILGQYCFYILHSISKVPLYSKSFYCLPTLKHSLRG